MMNQKKCLLTTLFGLSLLGSLDSAQGSLITIQDYSIDDAAVHLIEPPSPAPFVWSHAGTATNSVDRYFYLNTPTLYKYERSDLSAASGSLNDGSEGSFNSGSGVYTGTQIFVVNDGNKKFGDGSNAGGIANSSFKADPSITFNFASSSIVGDFFFRNFEDSNTLWQNVATLDVTIGATTVTVSGDTTVNNYDTKFSLSGTSLEGVSTSAVTLDNFALVNSTANEAFFVSEVEFFAAPPSAIPEPDTLAIWGLMGLSAGAFGLRRKIRLRS